MGGVRGYHAFCWLPWGNPAGSPPPFHIGKSSTYQMNSFGLFWALFFWPPECAGCFKWIAWEWMTHMWEDNEILEMNTYGKAEKLQALCSTQRCWELICWCKRITRTLNLDVLNKEDIIQNGTVICFLKRLFLFPLLSLSPSLWLATHTHTHTWRYMLSNSITNTRWAPLHLPKGILA